MKRWLLALGLLAAAALLPRLSHPSADLGKLDPAAVVQITRTGSVVEIRTDTGASGSGESLTEAVQALQSGNVRQVFLDTANYLLLENIPGEMVEELAAWFRPGCYVCRAGSQMDLKEAAEFLSVCPPEQTLARLWAEKTIRQTLRWEKGEWSLA